VKASLLIVPAEETDTNVAQQTIQQAAVDGFILYCMPDRSEAVARVLERKLPVVAVDQPEIKGIPFICIDDRQAARTAAEHLLSLNRQHLGVIAMDFHDDSYVGAVDAQRIERAIFRNALDRWRGYADAIQAAGLDHTLVPIEECPNKNGVEGAFAAAIALLQNHPRPTGILAMSDILALGALRAAEHLGLKVPEDVAIVGFDGIPLAAQVRPSLTTIQQPLVEKGAIAAEILLGIPNRKTTHILETKLVVRQSTGEWGVGSSYQLSVISK
jgi:DNA-binding LacI/PurR family transcriptional regulator